MYDIKIVSVRVLQRTLVLFLLLVMLLTACSSTKDVPEANPAAELPTSLPSATETPTPVPEVVVMTYPPEYDTKLLDETRTALAELAASAGMAFEEYPSLQAGEVKDNWKIVVLMDMPANLNELVATAPQTQFVAISSSEQPAAANLSYIVERPENQAFIAGYVTLMVASDWRAGALFANDATASSLQTDAFVNGGHYICGRCTSVWMPVKAFPLLAQMPAATDLATWQSVVAEMKMNVIYVMYVAPEVAGNDLLYELASSGMMLVGGASPPDEVRPVWAGTVRFDPVASLKDLWPSLVAGQGGQVVDAGIQFTDVNTQYFSQGRGRLAQKAVEALLEGAVDPLTPPL